MQTLALQKDVVITADIQPECFDTYRVDAIRIQQVFFNVLQNAIQYSRGVQDAWVRVSAKIIKPAVLTSLIDVDTFVSNQAKTYL